MGDIHIRIDEEPIIIRMEPASVYPIPFTSLTDAPTTYHDQANKFVKVKVTEDGLEFVVAAGLTDELVKYDSADPTAGYLSDKIKAGARVTLTEGTGADENKLIITADIQTTDISGKADLVNGLVPANQLPSYVDDVLEFVNLAGFPVTGESGKIYVALDTNLTYRWTGSVYGVLDPSLALGETQTTAYRGDRGKTAYDHSQTAHQPVGSYLVAADITGKADKTNVLELNNATAFTPDADYEPATKKYVDDNAGGVTTGFVIAMSIALG